MNNVPRLEARVSEQERRQAILEERVEEVTSGMKHLSNDMNASFAQLATYHITTEQQIDTRFNKVDERFNKVDERLDELTERFNAHCHEVDKRFEQVEKRFDRVEAHLGNLGARLGNMEAVLIQILARLPEYP
jgi:chromosome segregation ATPase